MIFLATSLLSGTLAIVPVAALGIAITLLLRRRFELKRFEQSHRARSEAIQKGSHKARLLHPDIDLTKCIGCGTCVKACPEDGVLDLLHGQAVIVHGARCVGHGRCADVCPTGAIALTFGDLTDRSDLPAIDENFEAVGVPGLFLAGELTGFSLVRTATSHGATVANAVAQRIEDSLPLNNPEVLDLLIVGIGPAGLACALRAKELGINYLVIEQADKVGGTVAAYPRKKMVMTQPIRLPLHGMLGKLEYMKEDLVELWSSLIDTHEVPTRTGVRLIDVVRGDDAVFTAKTSEGLIRARNVCLSLGRRGTPKKLGITGEDLPKVAYSLLDAESYNYRNILVVGGGDSAAEAAVGLSEQEGNTVTLVNRAPDWTRVKAKNEARINKAVQAGRLSVLMRANTQLIGPEEVVIHRTLGDRIEEVKLPNDDVFILIGGDPPFDLLKRAGVSFDPRMRPETATVADTTTPLLWATGLLLFLAIAMVLWGAFHLDYYTATLAERTLKDVHTLLRPSGKVGVALGIIAVLLFAWNLTYLARRSARVGRFLPGSLRFWMGSHVFTGFASFFFVMVHAGFIYRLTVGGFAMLSLGVVLTAGLVGRYFYSIVPHAANGREMRLDEVRARLTNLATTWEKSSRGLGESVRARVDALVAQDRWRPTLVGRAWQMLVSHFRIRRALRDLRHDHAFNDVPESERVELLDLARRSFRLSLQIAHYEEIRAVLSTWRYVHGWLALLMVLFVVAHVATAIRYARLDLPVPQSWIQHESPSRTANVEETP